MDRDLSCLVDLHRNLDITARYLKLRRCGGLNRTPDVSLFSLVSLDSVLQNKKRQVNSVVAGVYS